MRAATAAGAALAALALAGCQHLQPAASVTAEKAPTLEACPKGPPAGAKCWRGVDSKGAHYLIAMPEQWNGTLVVHAHGGPALEARRERADEDIARWAIHVKAGYAYAASVFRQGGVAVTAAAEDTDRVRTIFIDHVAKPKRTILHGQSWGGNVAARLAEMKTNGPGKSPYDAVLLTSGLLTGGTAAYNFRLDLRAVYQYYCNNHPLPAEAQYPLWMGLPKEAKLTRKELQSRVEECLGTAKARTPEQAKKSKAIADVIRIPETSILAHLNWATWHFQDIVQKRTGGKNPFTNEGVQYRGSFDDAALNAGVARYPRDPAGFAAFRDDADLAGRIGVPVLTTHGINDPTVFVEAQHSFAESMRRGGSGDRLVQTFVDSREHSYLGDPIYPTLLAALNDWLDGRGRPTPAAIATRCKSMEATFGPGCRFVPDYAVKPLDSRVPAR
jgi:pimeloyl-ACP methyl ester carboxylesterase